MQFVIVFCLALSASPISEPEYTGPAYAEQDSNARPVVARLKGAVMVWCVRLGMGPDRLERLFGSPFFSERFNTGPDEWRYPDLGVTVCFPAKLIKSNWLCPPERVHGGIQ